MESFCINPGLKTKALINIKWEKRGNTTHLKVFDICLEAGFIKKKSNGKYDAYITITGNKLEVGSNAKADIAMQAILDGIGLR